MTSDILSLLNLVAQGKMSPEQALETLRYQPFQELQSGVCLDLHRKLRLGQNEIIFAQGKSQTQLYQAISKLKENDQPVLVTKVRADQGPFLKDQFPLGSYWPEPGIFILGKKIDLNPPWEKDGQVIIVTAGSSDIPVALEALGASLFYDINTGLITDVGVAGLHRITPHLPRLQKAGLLIVVAGMEGALPSVLSGLLDKPIIAVPTSVGYGTSFGGLTALFGMLNSCAPGLSVVNIDNGLGAALTAHKILQNFST